MTVRIEPHPIPSPVTVVVTVTDANGETFMRETVIPIEYPDSYDANWTVEQVFAYQAGKMAKEGLRSIVFERMKREFGPAENWSRELRFKFRCSFHKGGFDFDEEAFEERMRSAEVSE